MDELTLNKSGLGVLKNIAHKLGVPGSKSHTKYTKKNKDELIQQILKFQTLKTKPKCESNNQIYMLLAAVGVIIGTASLYNKQKSTVANETEDHHREEEVAEHSQSKPTPKSPQVLHGPGMYSF